MENPRANIQKVELDDLYTALSAVTGEVIHEVAHTLSYLRMLMNLPQGTASVDQEEKTFAGLEIARLERLLGNLRPFKPPVPQRESVRLINVAQQVLEDIQNDRLPTAEVDVPSGLTVRGDSGFIAHAFRNLLAHAAAAAGLHGTYGINAALHKTDKGERVRLRIWDSGPPIPPESRRSVFLPWVTSGEGHPLRLAIAYSLARSLGWSLVYERTADRNEYRMELPAEAVEVLP